MGVHLRLKSIYKAFKQTGAAFRGNSSKVKKHMGSYSDNLNLRVSSEPSDSGSTGSNRGKSINGGGQSVAGDFASSPFHGCNVHPVPTWMVKKSGGQSISLHLPESVARFAEIHGKDINTRGKYLNNVNKDKLNSFSIKDDVGAVLQAAATAATAHDVTSLRNADMILNDNVLQNNSLQPNGEVLNCNNFCKKELPVTEGKTCFSISSASIGSINDDTSDNVGRSPKMKAMHKSDRFASRTQAEADAAAAELLAELDKEKLLTEANSKAKKKKKKKRKEKQKEKKEQGKKELKEKDLKPISKSKI